MIECIYRDSSEEDAEQLRNLMLELGYEIDKADLSGRIKLIVEQENKLIVAETDGMIVGVVQALVDIRLAEGKLGEIVSLVVRSDSRGSGLGKNLFTYAREFLVASGCNSIRVHVNTVREDAHEFYRSIGFTEKKTQKIFEVGKVEHGNPKA